MGRCNARSRHIDLKSDTADNELPEMELTDADILDAMQHIAGYIDISTEDFREIYHLAHRHAVGRLLGNFRIASLMRTEIVPLLHDMPLDEAAKALVNSIRRPPLTGPTRENPASMWHGSARWAPLAGSPSRQRGKGRRNCAAPRVSGQAKSTANRKNPARSW